MRRRGLVIGLAALALVASACHQRARRSGDEMPYPALDEAALDRTVSPCQDFYQFACGGWVAENPVPPDRTRWVRGTGEAEERNLRLLRRILEDAGAGKVDPQERFGRKAGDFYAACLDEADVEASGLAELQAEWARLDAVANRSALADELVRLEAAGLGAVLAVRAQTDPASSTRNLLVIGREGAGLPAWPPAAGAPEPTVAHVRAMLQLGGIPGGEAAQQAEAAVGLARAIDAAPGPGGLAPAPPDRLDRPALQQLAPAFPWGRFLEAIGAGRVQALGVADRGLVERVGRTFEEASIEAWRAHLKFRLAEAMAAERALPARFVEERGRFLASLGPTPPELRPRWKHCAEVTARTFAFTAGGSFARRALGASGRERAGWLVSSLERGMLVTVESAPWIDAPTQSRAVAKLDRLDELIGYPDEGIDYNALRVGRDSYFRNLLSAGRFAVAQEVARASRPADHREWVMEPGPFAVEPAYQPGRNVLSVPAGSLQPPLYIRDAPDPVIFGSTGTAIGRRLVEALQGEGRRRGPDGTAADWWTPAAKAAFEARSACLVEQYGSYEPISGVRLDGRRTLQANLADLAGLRAAYEAMRVERIRHPAQERRLLGFTPDQQFFMGYAQTQCTSATPEDLAHQAAHGATAPARFRVNGPLSNLPEFATAFRCDEGSPMVRPAWGRCDVW